MIFAKCGIFTTITKNYCWVKIIGSSQLTFESFYMYSFNFKIHILFFLPSPFCRRGWLVTLLLPRKS